MKIGYIRVSTEEQHTHLQVDALQAEGCERLFEDKMSGARWDRPAFQRMLDFARAGDIIVVWKLDRLGRTLKELIEIVNQLHTRGIELKSIMDHIDTSTATGKLHFHMTAALAEFERDTLRERTRAGLAAARARGRRGGKKPFEERFGHERVQQARRLYEAHVPVKDIVALTGIPRSTLYKHLISPLVHEKKERKEADNVQ